MIFQVTGWHSIHCPLSHISHGRHTPLLDYQHLHREGQSNGDRASHHNTRCFRHIRTPQVLTLTLPNFSFSLPSQAIFQWPELEILYNLFFFFGAPTILIKNTSYLLLKLKQMGTYLFSFVICDLTYFSHMNFKV